MSEQQPRRSHRHLDKPPIVEVACGFRFEALEGFDLFHQGRFWGELVDAYPRRQAQPLLVDLGATQTAELSRQPQLRAWYESDDRTSLVQLQHDRLVCNWRRGDGAYPRFRTRGDAVGLRDRAIAVYQQFSDYWRERADALPVLVAVELAKVDRFERGLHWESTNDLVALAPPLKFLFAGGLEVDEPRVDVFVEGRVHGVTTGVRWQTEVGEQGTRALLLTTTATRSVGGELADELDHLDDVVDDVFFDYLSAEAFALFGGEA